MKNAMLNVCRVMVAQLTAQPVKRIISLSITGVSSTVKRMNMSKKIAVDRVTLRVLHVTMVLRGRALNAE